MNPSIGETVLVRIGRSTWRKGFVVGIPTTHGALIVRWDNLNIRPLPGAWRRERSLWDSLQTA